MIFGIRISQDILNISFIIIELTKDYLRALEGIIQGFIRGSKTNI